MQPAASADPAHRTTTRVPRHPSRSRFFPFSKRVLSSFQVIPNLLQLITRRPPPGHDRHFVEEVRLREHLPRRNPRVEKLILICWILIAGKCGLMIWLIDRYEIKFDALWVNGPTVLFALMCTAAYFARD